MDHWALASQHSHTQRHNNILQSSAFNRRSRCTHSSCCSHSSIVSVCCSDNTAGKLLPLPPMISSESSRTQQEFNKMQPSTTSICSTPDTSCCSSSSSDLSSVVRFNDKVQVRAYKVILGDHPSVSAGPPLSLDWDYSSDEEWIGHDTEERTRRGSASQRRLSAQHRFDWLRSQGQSLESLARVSEEIALIKESRRQASEELVEEQHQEEIDQEGQNENQFEISTYRDMENANEHTRQQQGNQLNVNAYISMENFMGALPCVRLDI